jgi:3-dehydrosphinganine reductase
VDVLICNVGGSSQAPFEELEEAEFQRMLSLNFLSAVYSIRALVGGMKARRRGRIVLMSSQAGQLGLFGYTAYSPAKFALRGLAEALQMELTPFDVRVTVAFPPNTDTDGFAKEQLEMPAETAAISATAGTWEPDKVAGLIWEDVLEGNHYASVGLDGWLLARGTAGMSPEIDPLRALQQFLLAGLLRLVSLGYLQHFQSIVAKCKRDREKQD